MRALTIEQLNVVSGGLNPELGYGAQANGFQPNISAGDNGMGLGKDPLSNTIGGALIAGAGSLLGPMGTIGGAVLGGMLGGGAFNGSASSSVGMGN